MLSDKIILTESGFKSSSNANILHALSFLFLIVFNILFQTYTWKIILTYSLILFFSILFYIFYKMKIGSIYSVSYFYQFLLFISMTPNIYLNPFILIFTFSLFFLLLSKENFFTNYQFPIGIFLILLNSTFHIIFSKFNILNLKIVSFDVNPFSQILPNFSGLYFPKLFLLDAEFSTESFSCFENSGLFLLLIVFIFILKNKDIFRDLFTFLIFFGIFFLFFRSDSSHFIAQIFNYASIWMIFHLAPGRNSSIRNLITYTSLIPVIFLLSFIKGNVFSVFSILSVYYSFYGIQFYLVTKNNFIKELFLKFEN